MKKELKKELTLLDVFCVATGAMISSGLFILPGLAFAKAGPAVILSYIIAGIFCLPTLLSMAELTTAMPKAGGDYFYIMRGFGPLLGTLAGFSTWFSLSLKGAFALIGMGAYLSIITPLSINVIAFCLCVFFVVLNLMGVKEAGRFQVFLVLGLLGILISYVFLGMKAVNPVNFSPFFSKGLGPVFATASFVFISYGGLTKVAALAEETKNPGRNLPLGMILSLIVTSIFYVLVIVITMGVLNPESLKVTLTPISDGAAVFGGDTLKIIVSIGAFLAFISTANAGIMTASRYPLGMSRDKLLPAVFQKISLKFSTPYVAILCTGVFMIFAILFFKLELLVKVASSILILLYILANLTVILFRESKILSYRPKFYSPFYPYLQILGILGGGFLLIEMGSFIALLTSVFFMLGFIWYKVYAQKRAAQDSALIYVLEKLTVKDKELASDNLLTELKDIVIQREGIIEQKFYELVDESMVLDIESPLKLEDFFKEASLGLGESLGLNPEDLFNKFIEREEESSTVIAKGLAIPHIFISDKNVNRLVLVRARAGIIFPGDRLIHIAFILVSSPGERVLHLKILAAIAAIVQSQDFEKKWFEAKGEEELKHVIFLAERKRG
ncbi:MAG: amino acid permease [Candidatus Kaelpia aquatica]|nr:amino acid permease [Candidatus Kaelpia aquatica]